MSVPRLELELVVPRRRRPPPVEATARELRGSPGALPPLRWLHTNNRLVPAAPAAPAAPRAERAGKYTLQLHPR